MLIFAHCFGLIYKFLSIWQMPTFVFLFAIRWSFCIFFCMFSLRCLVSHSQFVPVSVSIFIYIFICIFLFLLQVELCFGFAFIWLVCAETVQLFPLMNWVSIWFLFVESRLECDHRRPLQRAELIVVCFAICHVCTDAVQQSMGRLWFAQFKLSHNLAQYDNYYDNHLISVGQSYCETVDLQNISPNNLQSAQQLPYFVLVSLLQFPFILNSAAKIFNM